MGNFILKHMRQIADLTQKQLAEKIGVHYSIISKIETGIIEIQLLTRLKILKVFREVIFQKVRLRN